VRDEVEEREEEQQPRCAVLKTFQVGELRLESEMRTGTTTATTTTATMETEMMRMRPELRRRKSIGEVLVGLPKKIRIARPKAVHDILRMVEVNTMKPIPRRLVG